MLHMEEMRIVILQGYQIWFKPNWLQV